LQVGKGEVAERILSGRKIGPKREKEGTGEGGQGKRGKIKNGKKSMESCEGKPQWRR